jgi:hypothetical protein
MVASQKQIGKQGSERFNKSARKFYLVLLRIQNGKYVRRRTTHETTKRRNATFASQSQWLYLDIFPISKNTSLAS